MGKVKQLFQAISYLQYPLLLVALGCVVYPYFAGFDTFWTSVNNALIFSGLAISFSTLQDTTYETAIQSGGRHRGCCDQSSAERAGFSSRMAYKCRPSCEI